MYSIPVLSFFSGGGFLDLGFEMAGFDIVWANEVHEAYADMYQTGISSWRQATRHDKAGLIPFVNKASIDQLNKSLICGEAFGTVIPDFFGMVGGPPCQDFTASGKNQGHTGDRGQWTQVYINLICELSPSFFLMENVPGLYRKKHRHYFDTIVHQLNTSIPGYLTSSVILNSLDLGVPQDRERLFLVGFRKDFIPNQAIVTSLLRDEQGWFPWPEPKFPNVKALDWPQTNPFGSKDIHVPKNIPLELTIHNHVQDEIDQLPNGQEVFKPYSEKFQLIAEGDVSGKSFKRLHRYRYSPTVWYGNNEVHLHPWKPRRLSVREALRIQTVPDEYVLPQEHTLTDKFRIISNGVPTLMAQQIAISILRYIQQQNIIEVPIQYSAVPV